MMRVINGEINMAQQVETVLNEGSLHLKPIRRTQGTPNLKGNIGRYNRMQFSSKVATGEWVNYDMTILAFNMLCNVVRDLGENVGGPQENWDIPTEKNGAFHAELKVGRDMDGVIYMSLRINAGETEKYTFKPERQYKFIKDSKPNISIESHLAARGWADFIQIQMNKAFADNYTPREANPSGNNNYNQYNKTAAPMAPAPGAAPQENYNTYVA